MLRGAKCILAALLCLAAAGVPARAAAPSPAVTATSTGSVNVSWTGGSSPYIAAISTSPSFTVTLASGSVSGSATSYAFLAPDTTYYLRVKTRSDADNLYATASSATWVAAPSGMYSLPLFFTAGSSYTAVANIGWNTNGNPEWTDYELSYADNSSFTGESVSPIGYPPAAQGGLKANTQYYFRVRARGVSDMLTPYAAYITTATAAMALPGVYSEVFESSAGVHWTPVNGSVPAQRAEGYQVLLSTSELMTPLTANLTETVRTVSSATLSALTMNTTYFYRGGTINISGMANMGDKASFTTLSQKPQGLARLGVTDAAATLGWTALPASPQTASALGYRLEASTSAAWTGTRQSSSSYGVALSTLTINTLDPNTTYYFRAGSLNSAGQPNYGSTLSSVTLSLALSPSLIYVTPGAQQMTVAFTPLPGSPQAFACEGYRLEASTAPFGGGGVVFSSVTRTMDPYISLTIGSLNPNTVYNLRLGTLNWEDTPNYTLLTSTRTGIPGSLGGVTLASVWSSSASVTFNPGVATEGYVAEASQYRYFNSLAASAATANPAAAGLIINGLVPNTSYYFRAGSLYNGATVYTEAAPFLQQTLPVTVTLAAPPHSGVFYSSVTVSWTPLPYSPQSATSEGYILEASTAADFTGALLSSRTANVALDHLTVSGLAPNTSYYFRNGSLNLEDRANYVYTGSTVTMANPASQSSFVLTPTSINLNWLANSNPPDTRYLAELYTDATFAAPSSSVTVLSSATFSGLLPNTTYYTRVTAYNRLGRAAPTVVFSPMATGAYFPDFAAYLPSDVGISSLTARWGAGTPANPAGTIYLASISSSTDFTGLVISSYTQALNASFAGLVSNASYYMRVSALNLTGVPTDPVPLGSPLTMPATPYMLPEVRAFTGAMTDGFTFNWTDNGNSSHTLYNVELSSVSDFSAMTGSATVQGLSCMFSGLALDTTYWLRARAVGQAGAVSDFSVAGSTKTLLYSLLNAVAMRESTIQLQTSYGVISLYLPRGSIGSSTRIWLQPESSFGAPVSAVSALEPTGIGLKITHFPPTLVLGAVTITLPYRVSDLPSSMRDTTSRSKLILALYDETNQIWVPLPSVSDTAANKVVAQTWHLSTFQLMKARSETGLASVKVYPNPYRPNSVSDVMHFTNMTPYAKVKIYTFLGELVREIKADVNGMAAWDGLNADGRKVASGVYITYIQSKDGRSAKSLKVAIER